MQWGMLVRATVAGAISTSPVVAETYAEISARQPRLFHTDTGYRSDRYRAPIPDDAPAGVGILDAEGTAAIAPNALLIDAMGALQSRYDELDGTWLVFEPRQSLPGAIWLPEIGRGTISAELSRYLETNLIRLTDGNVEQPIVVFCTADCWMSWNAAARIASLGYKDVHWFPLGVDGWLDSGRTLEAIDPVPVDVN